jgi:hypothetical protein
VDVITLNIGYYDEYNQWIFNQWWYNYFHAVAKKEYPIDLNRLQRSLIEYNAKIDSKQQIHFNDENDYLYFMLKWS